MGRLAAWQAGRLHWRHRPNLYEFAYPVAERLLQHCDAVLRLPGASKGADEDVRLARERGLPVYFDISEVPGTR